LGIDHQREHATLAHQDTVLLAELVVRKALETPFDEVNRFDQKLREVVILGMANLELFHLAQEFLTQEDLPILRWERPSI
jgi:hypothetical protein